MNRRLFVMKIQKKKNKFLSDESDFSYSSFEEDSDKYDDDKYITSRDGK